MASTDVPAYVATAEERLARIVASGLDATSLVPALAING
jgi:hypothetical protein